MEIATSEAYSKSQLGVVTTSVSCRSVTELPVCLIATVRENRGGEVLLWYRMERCGGRRNCDKPQAKLEDLRRTLMIGIFINKPRHMQLNAKKKLTDLRRQRLATGFGTAIEQRDSGSVKDHA